MGCFWISLSLCLMAAMYSHMGYKVESVDIGVNFGMLGDNLPAPADVVGLYKKYGVTKMRLFEPKADVLEALRGSQISVSLCVRNEDMESIGSSPEGANSWFDTNVGPYLDSVNFRYISVGNEVIPGPLASFVQPAMQNLQQILDAKSLTGISVSTAVSGAILASSYPPSAGAFTSDAHDSTVSVLQFLSDHGSPLMINVYPYFAYASDPVNIRLDYAQFTAPGPVVQDGTVNYQNLFDAMVDSYYAAMEREGFSNVAVVVSATGWPSAASGDFTTPDLASTYNKNFVNHVTTSGTPRRPDAHIEGYIFAMFNEDQKPPGTEQNWGLFCPTTMEPVYPVLDPISY